MRSPTRFLIALAAHAVLTPSVARAGGGEMPPVNPDEGPRFLNFRFDEDYTYLDEYPGQRGNDPRMALKTIHAGDDLRFDCGGG